MDRNQQVRALLKGLRQYGTATTEHTKVCDFWLIADKGQMPAVLNVSFMDPATKWPTLISHPEYLERHIQRMFEAETVLRALYVPYRRNGNGQFLLNGYKFNEFQWHGGMRKD